VLSVRLTPEMESRLDRLCRETGRSRSGLVKEALARFLGEDAVAGTGMSGPQYTGRGAARLAGHARIEARSMAMHRAISDKVRRNPRLLDAARENIRRWRRQGVDVAAFAEWEAILDRGLAEALHVLTDPSEEGSRLRHSTPFTGVLTPEERRRFFEAPRA
jgi:Arc/MetJ-type ribon-helix-helix transcriptional regulator